MIEKIKNKLISIKDACKEAMVSKNKYMGSEEFNKKSILKQAGVMTLTAWFQLIPVSLYVLFTSNPLMAKYTFLGFWVSAITLIPLLNLIYIPLVKLINKSTIITKIFSIFKSNKKIEGEVKAEYYKDNFIGRTLYFLKAISTSLYTFIPVMILSNIFLTYMEFNLPVFFWINFTLIFTLVSSGLTSIYSIKLIKEIIKKFERKKVENIVEKKEENVPYTPKRVTGKETFSATLYKEFDKTEIRK